MGMSTGKTVCIVLTVIGLLAMLAGSAAPYWASLDFLITQNYGLWYYCFEVLGSTQCARYAWTLVDPAYNSIYFYVVHAGAGLASLLALVAALAGMVKMCCSDSPEATGVGVTALIAGLLGIGVSVIFFLETSNSLAVVAEVPAWGFFIFLSGSAVAALFSIFVLALPSGESGGVVHPMY